MPQSNQLQLKVARKSGFPQRHHWLGTADVGSLVPTLVQEVIPGSIVNLRAVHSIAMPPLASDAYMKLDYRTEAFFVPMRLLYGGFESWFTQRERFVLDNGGLESYSIGLPYIRQYSFSNNLQDMGPGTLSDYLGYKAGPDELADGDAFVDMTLLPFLAYHKIWDDWYRAPSVQRSCFASLFSNVGAIPTNPHAVSVLPSVCLEDNPSFLQFTHDSDNDNVFEMADGHPIYVIRQRNFGFDYFTNALPNSQLGDAVKVTADSSGQFSIAQFRALNSMQRFKERNNIAGNRYVDTLKARYGVDLSNGVAQRSLFLGSAVYDVYNKTVDVSGTNGVDSSLSLPWSSSAGAQLGRAYAGGQDKLIDEFHVQEPGYIFVIGSLVPRVSYGSGVRKLLTRYTKPGCITDMANAELQNVGVEPVYQYELVTEKAFTGGSFGDPEAVFGYTDRYASFMTMEDEIHGLFYGGNNLSIMAPQRLFGGASRPVISSSFLEIPINYLDNVTTINAAIRSYGYWIDADFDLRIVAPLMSPGTLPSLENPAYEHGDTVTVHRGGFRL